MDIALAIIFGVIIIFGFVILFGAPYLPTLKPQIKIALDMLDLQPGQTLIEIGSGDGRVLKAAAERGWNAVGYELNPVLVEVWQELICICSNDKGFITYWYDYFSTVELVA